MALPEASFIWGANGAKLTPEEIAMQRALLARKGGIDTSPVGHWTQGAARVADAIAGAFQRGNLDKQEAANTAYDAELASPLAAALAGGVAAYPESVAAGGSGTADAAVGLPAEAPAIKAKLIERGLPEHVADGFVANFADESGLNPGINEQNPTVAGSRGGYGLYQLTGPRRVAYESFAKERGVAPSDVDTQLDFLVSELKGPEAGAAAKIFAAPDSGSAAAAIATNFLRPNANSLAQRVAKYTSGVPQIPVQTASLDPSVGMATAYAPEAATVPPAAAAIEAVAPTQQIGIPMPGEPGSGLTPEQAAQIQVAADPTGQTTVASAMQAQPLPGADQGIGGVAYEQVPPVMPPQPAQVAAGAPMAQPPADVSRVPALSGANGLPVVGPTGEPSASPISGQARVAAALQAYPVQAQAAAGDQMVAGADQTLQPGAEQAGAFPAAPVGAPANTAPVAQPGYLDAAGGGQSQAQGNPIAAAVRAISDPRASPQTKAVAELVIKQAQQRQAAVAEQQVWQQRQAFEAQQQANDPKRQLELRKLQQEVDGGKRQPLVNAGEGRIYDPNSGTWLTAPGAEAKVPDSVQALDLRAKRAGLKEGSPEYNQFMISGGQKSTSLTIGPDGQVQYNEGPTGTGKPLTESQSKLTLFQSLQTETQPVLLDLEKQFNPANLNDAAARSTPIAGNFFKSEQGQIYDSAATAWAEGALRIATGAAATPEEMERTKRAYFAQPGDTPNTMAFKAQMREMYNRSIDRSLGKKSEGSLPNPSEFAKTLSQTVGEEDPNQIDDLVKKYGGQ